MFWLMKLIADLAPIFKSGLQNRATKTLRSTDSNFPPRARRQKLVVQFRSDAWPISISIKEIGDRP